MLDFSNKVIIVSDLNADLNRQSYLTKELLNMCDNRGLSIENTDITRARMVAGVLQESSLDLLLSNFKPKNSAISAITVYLK